MLSIKIISCAGRGPLGRATLSAVIAAFAALAAADATSSAPHAYTLSLAGGSRLMINARINGVATRALLDSAAEVTILDREFARRLQLGGGQAVTGQGSGQTTFEAALIEGVTLEAVGLSLANQSVAIADLGDVGRRLLKRRVDVILGREIFDAARLAIDIDGRRITVVTRERAPRGVRLELSAEHGVETVPVSVEKGGPVRATFDLGNGSHVLISKSFAARQGLLSDGRAVTTERGGGLGGETARQLITLRDLELAGRHFSNVMAAIDPQPSASDVNVGTSVLRHFRITTDYAGRAVWLEPRD